jgi:hypothetical protein
MTSRDTPGPPSARNLEDALNQLDIAQETLEGLDELGVATREQLVDLMNTLESEIGDAEPTS